MHSVNLATVKQVPVEAMMQLGQFLQLLIATLADKYYKNIPFRFAKIGIKDGFWRLSVSNIDLWNFYCVIPQACKVKNIEYIKVVVPNFLQIGWCESPPFLCAESETARDIIDTLLYKVNLP